MNHSESASRIVSIARRALLGSTALLLAPSALAQQAAPPIAEEERPEAFSDIVVTARRNAESLQEVPVTVSVVDGRTLDSYKATKAEDIASRVPTLSVQVGGSGSGGSIALRGVGSSAISAAFDSAVAFDFDGVQISTMRLVQAGFFDVGQIEVLKGPQSLYFGKSASAGVFALKSAEPTSTWQFGARGSYEFEEKGWIVGGFASGPLTDTLGIRIAAQYTDVERYQRLQIGTPAVRNPRGLKDFVGRLTLNFEPLDTFRANLKFQYVRNENDGALAQSEVSCGANGRADEMYLLSGAVAIPAGYDCNVTDQRYFYPDTAPPLARSVPPPSKAVGFNGVPFGETNLYFGRLRIDGDISDSLTLTSTTGYVDLNAIEADNFGYGGIGPAFTPIPGATLAAVAPALAAANGPGVPMGVGTSDPMNGLKQMSQELRLASNFDGPINFMLGAFYEHRQFIFDTAQQGVNGYTFDWDKIHRTTTDALSFFGSLSVNPTDNLEISGGLRYTDEKKVQTISVPYVHTFLSSGPAFVKSGFFSGPIEFQDDNLSPEVTVKYKITPSFNVFASYKTGFKSGGIDNSALPSNSLSQAALTGNFDALKYKSEKAKGGEVGFKSQFAGDTVTLNGTIYYYEFKDLQVQIFNAQAVQFITLNAGKATTKGAELEMRWRPPVDGLAFSANLAYLDGKYNDFLLPGPDVQPGTADDVDLSGRKIARAPKFSGNVAFDWTIPVGDSLSIATGGNMTFSDKYLTNNSTLADYVQDGWVTFDARISIGDRDDRWRLALVGVNIANKVYTQTSGDRPFLAPANPFGVPPGDDVILNQNRGRQVFVEASVRF